MKLNSKQKELCKNIDYSFKNFKLLEQALVHSSLKSKGLNNNQRMEFLGDRILGFVISDYLFNNYPTDGIVVKINSRKLQLIREKSYGTYPFWQTAIIF